ncbi:MAG: DUF2782 domain-containing protein [Casimicrobiaceae bacterium]
MQTPALHATQHTVFARRRGPAIMIAIAAALALCAPTAFVRAQRTDAPPAAGKPPPPLPAATTPPPLPSFAGDADANDAPQVTVIHRDQQVVEEVRVHGQLRYIRVTPAHGRPYYLIPDAAGGTFARRDSIDSTLMVPLWVLFTF